MKKYLQKNTEKSPELRQKNIDDLRLMDDQTVTIRSSLCDYSDAYILVKGTITAVNSSI